MDIIKKTINKANQTINRYHMLRQGDRVVVAVSGGPDSVCLLDILNSLKDDLGIELIVAHLDHGLRPGEDEPETRFVEALAGSLDLPFKAGKAGPGIKQGRGSLEERARHARYEFLEKVKSSFSAQKIAVGHNLNDQAETILMRLLRGSGPSGLAGIPPIRDEKIIRPLIELTCSEIAVYLEQRGLAYMTDSSNLETRYLRNKIRLELLPELKKYQPRIVELLGQTGEIMRRDNEWLEAEAGTWVEKHAEITNNGQIQVHLPSFRELPEGLQNRIIRDILRITGKGLRRVSSRHIEAIHHAAMEGKAQSVFNLPNNIVVKKVYERLVFSVMKQTGPMEFRYLLDRPGTFHLDAPGYDISLRQIKKNALHDMKASPWTVFMNADLLDFPLLIRNSRPGDRFVPLGMNGHKKIKDLFIDLKVPSEERKRIPVLINKKTLIWVCGFRIDDRYKITPQTRNILIVSLKKSQAGIGEAHPL